MKNRLLHAICLPIWLAAVAAGYCQKPATGPKPVEVAEVVEAEVSLGRRVVGTVAPLRMSIVGSAVDGRVQRYFVDEGQSVRSGEPLAQLLTNTLEIELAASEAELQLFEYRLAELKNGSRAEDVAEARANMLRANSNMENAKTKLRRVESLASTRAASSADFDNAKREYEAAQFTLQATEALLKRIEAGPRAEAISQAQAQVELQRQRTNLLKNRLSKFTIRAPFDGVVSAEFTEVGAWVSRGDPIAQVIQLDEVEIRTPVTAESVVRLQSGDTVRVEFPELPEQLFTASVDRIVPMADPRARTFPVMLRMKNIERDGKLLLLAGMMARVDIPTGQRQTLPLVPKDALVLNAYERSVYVVDPISATEGSDERKPGERLGGARKVDVQLGVAVGDRIQVKASIKPGQLVVVVGNERLVPGAEVRYSDSAATLSASRP